MQTRYLRCREFCSRLLATNVRHWVRHAIVDLTVHQQLSNFVVRQTGVNNPPTLAKRKVRTSSSVNDGDVIVGGLDEDRESSDRIGFSFLPAWKKSDTGQKSKSETLPVLRSPKSDCLYDEPMTPTMFCRCRRHMSRSGFAQ